MTMWPGFERYAVGGLAGPPGAGYRLEPLAVRVVEDIEELRGAGEFPSCARVTVTVFAGERVIQTRIDGLSVAWDPDRRATFAALRTVFEVASLYNFADLSGGTPPAFVQRVVAVGPDGVPYAALVGTALGDVERSMPTSCASPES